MASRQQVRRRNQGGFGLLETLIAMSLMALMFLGAMDLILSSNRATVRTQSQVYAIGDAANSIQKVIVGLREASVFMLPTGGPSAQVYETGWITPTGTTLGQFNTTLNGAAISTALEYANPIPLATPTQVMSTVANKPIGITPYDISTTATAITLIYRGDPNGTPNAGTGTYLWQYTIPPDGSFNLAASPPTVLCKSVGTAADAVQFVRPSYAQVYEANQLEIKIVSSYYSPINGQQTSEEGNSASTSQLVGKCVYMRDHSTSPKQGVGATQQSNNPFQYN